jgi:hypothetical protein
MFFCLSVIDVLSVRLIDCARGCMNTIHIKVCIQNYVFVHVRYKRMLCQFAFQYVDEYIMAIVHSMARCPIRK